MTGTPLDGPAGRPAPGERPGGINQIPAEPEAPFRLFRLPSTFASFRHRNFKIFFFGQLISLIGTWMQIAALGWLVYALTDSKEMLGIVGGVRMLPMIFFSLVGGVVADRHPKRRVILLTQTLFMLLALLLAVLVFLEAAAVEHIVILSVLSGCVLAFDMPARHSFVVELVEREDVSNAIALNSSIFNAARILGPALSGVLMMKAGIAFCFLVNGLSYLAVIAGLLAMRLAPRAEPDGEDARTALKQVAEGFSIIAGRPAIRGLLVLVAVTGVFGLSYGVMMPAFARDVLGQQEEGYGLLLSVNGAGALIGGLVVASLARSRHKPHIIVAGVMMFSAMLYLFASCHAFWPAALCLAGVGMGFMFFMSTGNALVQTGVPDAARGRVMGVWSFTFVGAMPIGSLQIGFLSEHLGGGAPLAVKIGSVICAACGLYALYMLVTRKKSKAPQDEGSSSS